MIEGFRPQSLVHMFWPAPSSNKESSLSFPSLFSFALNQGIEFCSKRIFFYIEEIYYSGIGLSAVAILAALTASVVWTVLFAAGAALCFALAGWAYRAGRASLSYGYHLVNVQYLRSQQTGEANLLKMREFEKKIGELEIFIEQLTEEISSLRSLNEEQSKKIADLNRLLANTQELRNELVSLKEKLRRLVGSAGDLRNYV